MHVAASKLTGLVPTGMLLYKKKTVVSKIITPEKVFFTRILRSCGPAYCKARKPQNPENTKKYKMPHPGLATQKDRKNTEKNTKTAQKRQFWPVLYFFFSVFFLYFRVANLGWGILYFFLIFGILGFSGSVAGPQDRNPNQLGAG